MTHHQVGLLRSETRFDLPRHLLNCPESDEHVILEEATALLLDSTTRLRELGKPLLLGLTAGRDSRAILAALVHEGTDFHALTNMTVATDEVGPAKQLISLAAVKPHVLSHTVIDRTSSPPHEEWGLPWADPTDDWFIPAPLVKWFTNDFRDQRLAWITYQALRRNGHVMSGQFCPPLAGEGDRTDLPRLEAARHVAITGLWGEITRATSFDVMMLDSDKDPVARILKRKPASRGLVSTSSQDFTRRWLQSYFGQAVFESVPTWRAAEIYVTQGPRSRRFIVPDLAHSRTAPFALPRLAQLGLGMPPARRAESWLTIQIAERLLPGCSRIQFSHEVKRSNIRGDDGNRTPAWKSSQFLDLLTLADSDIFDIDSLARLPSVGEESPLRADRAAHFLYFNVATRLIVDRL